MTSDRSVPPVERVYALRVLARALRVFQSIPRIRLALSPPAQPLSYVLSSHPTFISPASEHDPIECDFNTEVASSRTVTSRHQRHLKIFLPHSPKWLAEWDRAKRSSPCTTNQAYPTTFHLPHRYQPLTHSHLSKLLHILPLPPVKPFRHHY